MAQTKIQNRLSAIRGARGIGAAGLAKRVGVSRQTIYAIEAGSYVPNTQVSLRLARELDVSVEALFSLEEEKRLDQRPLQSTLLSATTPPKGTAVRVCRIGDQLVSIPVNAGPYLLPEADGVISRSGRSESKVDVTIANKWDAPAKRLVLAGCDPALGLLAKMVERDSGVEVLTAEASSRLALSWLRDGRIHIAGSHLKDPETGDFNLPILRREFPGEDLVVVTFAGWEEGFVTAPGNSKSIKTVADLARRRVRFVNRENGSGSRALLENLLAEAGIPGKKVEGYSRVARGHLAAAYSVYREDADCCIATSAAARSFGLHFLPIQSERYDFVMRRQTLELPQVQSFLDTLQRAQLRRTLGVLAGYDTSQTGAVLS